MLPTWLLRGLATKKISTIIINIPTRGIFIKPPINELIMHKSRQEIFIQLVKYWNGYFHAGRGCPAAFLLKEGLHTVYNKLFNTPMSCVSSTHSHERGFRCVWESHIYIRRFRILIPRFRWKSTGRKVREPTNGLLTHQWFETFCQHDQINIIWTL